MDDTEDISTIKEKELIDFYYKNQSKGVRHNIQNRLFIDENLSCANSVCAIVYNFKEISLDVRILLKCHPALSNI